MAKELQVFRIHMKDSPRENLWFYLPVSSNMMTAGKPRRNMVDCQSVRNIMCIACVSFFVQVRPTKFCESSGYILGFAEDDFLFSRWEIHYDRGIYREYFFWWFLKQSYVYVYVSAHHAPKCNPLSQCVCVSCIYPCLCVRYLHIYDHK